MTPRRIASSLLALAPVLSAVAFYGWLEWMNSYQDCGPKYLPGTGIPTTLTAIPFILIPPVITAAGAARTAKSWLAVTALSICTLLLTAAALTFTFLIWFGEHHCGE